jgi:hypothetical protein
MFGLKTALFGSLGAFFADPILPSLISLWKTDCTPPFAVCCRRRSLPGGFRRPNPGSGIVKGPIASPKDGSDSERQREPAVHVCALETPRERGLRCCLESGRRGPELTQEPGVAERNTIFESELISLRIRGPIREDWIRSNRRDSAISTFRGDHHKMRIDCPSFL